MQQQLVQLTVAPDPAQVAPGALLPIALSVHNTTRDALRGRIVARGLEGGWSELSTPLTVASDATVGATLALRPDASLREGHYPLTVAVMAEDDRTVYATTTVDLRVGDDVTVVMDVQPAEVEGPSGAFLVTAYNGTRWISAIELTVRDRDGGALNVSITPRDLLVVLPGAAVTAQARVTPAREAREEPDTAARVYEIEVLGLQTGQSASQSGPSLRREVRFVYAPRSGGARAGRMVGLPLLSRGAALWIAASGVLLALLLVIGTRVFAGGGFAAAPAATPTRTVAHMRTATTTPAGRGIAGAASPTPRPTATAVATSTPAAPRIGQFTLAQRRHDAPYLLVWRTSHGTTVTLNGKPVAPSGQRKLAWPLKDATYRLVAGTGTRRTTRQLQVTVDASGADHYAGQSIRLSRPRVIAFTLVRRGGALYAAWQVSNAVQARLQGQPVYEAGERIVPRGAATMMLRLANAVGITQRVLRVPVIQPTPTPRLTATATLTPRPRPTATATATATPLPTVMATPLPSPTAPPRPTKTPIATATAMPTATATSLPPTATATPLPSPTAPPRPTKTPAATATATARPTRTPRPTATATARPAKTPRPTATAPPRPTKTPRPTATATASPTRTPTATPRPTRTPKPTATATARPTRTPRPTATATATPSPTKTPRPTATPRPTRTPRPTAIPAPTATMIALPTGQIIPPTPRSRAARPTAMPRPTATPTVPPTPTPTRTPRPTATDTATPQPTATLQQGAIGTIAPNVLFPTATPQTAP